MTAKSFYHLETEPKCVLTDGPYEIDGDGAFEYCVCFGDDDGEPITENRKAIWYCWEYSEVVKLGRELAQRWRLELVNEAMAA